MHCEGARDEPDVSVARSREESIMPQAPMLQHSGIVPHARAKSLSSRRSGDEPSLHLVLAVSVHLSSAAQYPWMQADPDEHGEEENIGQRDADGAADGHEGGDDVKERVGRYRRRRRRRYGERA